MLTTPVYTKPARLAALLAAGLFTLAACGSGGNKPSINAPTAPPPKVEEPEPVDPKPQPENPQMLDGATKTAPLPALNNPAPAAGSFLKITGAQEMLFNAAGADNEQKRVSPTVRRNNDTIDYGIKTNSSGTRFTGLHKAYYDDNGQLTGLHMGSSNMALAILGDYLAGNAKLKRYTTNDEAKGSNSLAYYDAGLAVGGAFGGIYSSPTTAHASNYVWRDPAVAGWNYQTFGYFLGSGTLETDWGYQSIGIPTANLPTQGGAEYKGIATAEYRENGTPYQLTANSRVYANFEERKLNFTTEGTDRHAMTPTGLGAAEHARNLNLNGVATWDAGNAAFKGAVQSAFPEVDGLKGTLEGRFYGPQAAEVGGVFGLQNEDKSKTLIGGFGGKRE